MLLTGLLCDRDCTNIKFYRDKLKITPIKGKELCTFIFMVFCRDRRLHGSIRRQIDTNKDVQVK
jgi:hypothetical protein